MCHIFGNRPIHEKTNSSDVSNYRPISLLSTVSKVSEKIVHNYFFNFFQDNNVITAFQSSFVPGDFTVNRLIDIYNTFCKAFDEGKEVHAIFCDTSEAFDRVWHKGLFFKLKSAGVSGSLLTCGCCMALARDAMGLSAVCDCGTS